MKRMLDFSSSLIALVLLSPLLLIIAFLVMIDSRGGIVYVQKRVGKENRDFNLYKFRTMYMNSDGKGLLTIGDRDSRVTKIGYFLRKYKLDELPQLFNVLEGNMSLVGPRPEVRKYVQFYSPEQKQVLSVRPGITDYASIVFRNEAELMVNADDPESYYITTILPIKLRYSLDYIKRKSITEDIKIIFLTIFKILK
ncbi:sugar transferase [Solitalea koreensis]|nr:sugar transferase [Solitalea koreensis]